MRAWES